MNYYENLPQPGDVIEIKQSNLHKHAATSGKVLSADARDITVEIDGKPCMFRASDRRIGKVLVRNNAQVKS